MRRTSGWGYQSSDGRQGFGGWSGVERRLHINVKELLVPLLFLRSNPIPEGTALCFEMDNMVAVHCLARQGTSKSALLLSLSEQIFGLAARFHLHLSARFLPGVENVWADALSRFRGSSVEWQLRPERFAALCRGWGTFPGVDLFPSRRSAQLQGHF
ncbi:hypothetical protein GWK47_051190 [Chionoecetes opilio]|uniref:Uncharacterized protein n=1 Tax=Chionoecetes opilio TaxID=41210 RepID=A0A8J5CSH8_CHIOP|nr:hypothetical protein GWK47_051190 [Chionoecetes opilio]